MEDRRFRRVQVFGFALAHDPSAEADGAATGVADRKHHAFAETVVVLAAFAQLLAFTGLAADQHAGLLQQLALTGRGAQRFQQTVPAGGGIAEAVTLGDLAGDAAFLQVGHGGRTFRFTELFLEVETHFGEQCVELFAQRGLRVATVLARHFDAGAFGQRLDGGGELDAVVGHDEANDVAGHATAEALVELLALRHRKRRRLFAMKGTAGPVVLALLFQRQARLHHIDDIDAAEQILDERLGYATGHGQGFAAGSGIMRQPSAASKPAGQTIDDKGNYSKAPQAPSVALMRPDSAPMSARPATCGLSAFMTLPMSLMPAAPVSATTAAISASSSASLSGVGR